MKKNNIVILMLVLVFFFGKGFCQSESTGFIPNKLPPGFAFSHPPESYGTYEHPRKNGTIFDFINGGGVVYIDHGFRDVTHIVIEDKAKNTMTIDIFNMGKPANAAAAFADEAICAKGFIETDIGTVAKSYHYEPDYLIYFIKGKYLVYLALSNDTLSGKLKQLAAGIYEDIK